METRKNFEKLQEKYGYVFFNAVVGEMEIFDSAYYLFLLNRASLKREIISTYIFYGMALAMVIVSFWLPGLVTTSVILLLLGVQAGLNVRIDRINERLDRENLFEMIEQHPKMHKKMSDTLLNKKQK